MFTQLVVLLVVVVVALVDVVAEVVDFTYVEFLELSVIELLYLLDQLGLLEFLEFVADFVHVLGQHGEAVGEVLVVGLLVDGVPDLAGEQFVQGDADPVLEVVLGGGNAVGLVLLLQQGLVLLAHHFVGRHVRRRSDFCFFDFILDFVDVFFKFEVLFL